MGAPQQPVEDQPAVNQLKQDEGQEAGDVGEETDHGQGQEEEEAADHSGLALHAVFWMGLSDICWWWRLVYKAVPSYLQATVYTPCLSVCFVVIYR